MKRLLLASDSFKGTLSTSDIVNIASSVIDEYFKDEWTLDPLLIADGGEGTLDAFFPYWEGERIEVESVDAEGNPIKAPLLLNSKGEALIEAASVIGLPLIKGTLSPLERTTKGFGILIKKAVSLGAKKIFVGLGGSSTNDLGIGMLSELGIKFLGIKEPTMKEASSIKGIDASSFCLKGKDIQFACLSDVTNPLLGRNGATYVYGPQKGYEDLEELEKSMSKLASLYEKATSKSLQNQPGLGAAGGLCAAFYAFMDAKIESGIETLLKLSNFEERAAKADLIITGEGSFDEQSLQGKVYSGIRRHAPKEKLAVICGTNKLAHPEVPVYEISKKNSSFPYIKEHAKEDYAKALRKVLEERK